MTPLLNIVGSSLALLVFLVAYYALLARERKTPYITNYIFPPASLIFLAVLLVLVEQLVQGWRAGFANMFTSAATSSQSRGTPVTRSDYWLVAGAYACFYLGALKIFMNIWRLHNRQVNFRDDNRVKNLRITRHLKHWWERQSASPAYAHNPAEIDDSTIRAALGTSRLGGGAKDAEGQIRTLAICGYPLCETDTTVPALAAELLKKDWLVQYTTCSRHPCEWVSKLKTQVGKAWVEKAGRVTVVDAYTPHFGFNDSIHARKADDVTSEGVVYVSSPESYAGVHTATAKAFNAQKKKAAGNVRLPTVLIYEGCRALADLESPEQYRLFLRHVLTSERMWGGAC
jgi:hypothetical protein